MLLWVRHIQIAARFSDSAGSALGRHPAHLWEHSGLAIYARTAPNGRRSACASSWAQRRPWSRGPDRCDHIHARTPQRRHLRPVRSPLRPWNRWQWPLATPPERDVSRKKGKLRRRDAVHSRNAALPFRQNGVRRDTARPTAWHGPPCVRLAGRSPTACRSKIGRGEAGSP